MAERFPNQQLEGLSIRLVRNGVSAQQMTAMALDELVLEDAPFLSDDDMVGYEWESHEIELTERGYEKLTNLDVPVHGVPFVVCVGEERIYGGAFWVSWSSLSFPGMVIDTLPAMMERPVRIQLGYPESPELFQGEDLRGDDRIRQALAKAEKLE